MGQTTESSAVTELGWPGARLGEALSALARETGLSAGASAPLAGPGGEDVGPWIEAAAAWMGLEAEPVEAPYPDVGQLVAAAGPAVLRLDGPAGPRFLVLLGGGSGPTSGSD